MPDLRYLYSQSVVFKSRSVKCEPLWQTRRMVLTGTWTSKFFRRWRTTTGKSGARIPSRLEEEVISPSQTVSLLPALL